MNGIAQTIWTWVGNASFPYLLDISAKSAFVLAGTFLASLLLRRASASVRHHVWSMALASILILPLLVAALPAWRLPILPRMPADTPSRARSESPTAPPGAGQAFR